MPYITVGQENSADIRLYYEDHGSGRPVVLIHGYPLSSASWEKQVPALLKAGHRVIAYDRRGFGNSDQPSTGYNYDTFAEDLRQLIQALNLKDLSLVGFSMGGGEVVRYIGRYGTSGLRKVGILGGVPPFLVRTSDNPDGLEQSVFDGIQQALVTDRYAFFEEFFRNFFNTDVHMGKRISEQAVRASWNVAARSSAIASVACVPAWAEDFRQDVTRIDIPAIVIHGKADRIVPFEASGKRTAAMIRDVRLITIEDGPHAINWTHAEEVNRALLELLQ